MENVLNRSRVIAIGLTVSVIALGVALLAHRKPASPVDAISNSAALTVTTVSPDVRNWPQTITATGNVQAWQEAIIGAEVSGLRLAEVAANVGDAVKKGQLLARFSDEMVVNDLEQQRAALDEASAILAEAEVKEASAKKLRESGVLSEHAIIQSLTAAQVARAQLQTAQARFQAQKLRLGYTRVLASDDGIISSRTATVGAVMQPGSELFRLIRRGKLEWHAELPADQLPKIKVGQNVTLNSAPDDAVTGTVRRISPVVDTQSRNGSVYVELAASKSLKAGMFAQGDFNLGHAPALTLPQGTLVVRDGFNYVYLMSADNHVKQVKVVAGRRWEERIEIMDGLQADAVVVASGAGFLSDGDRVNVSNETHVAKK